MSERDDTTPATRILNLRYADAGPPLPGERISQAAAAAHERTREAILAAFGVTDAEVGDPMFDSYDQAREAARAHEAAFTARVAETLTATRRCEVCGHDIAAVAWYGTEPGDHAVIVDTDGPALTLVDNGDPDTYAIRADSTVRLDICKQVRPNL